MPLSEDHFFHVWAAWRRGVFKDNALFPKSADKYEFTVFLAAFQEAVEKAGNDLVVGVTTIPVLLVSVEYSGNLAIPHAVWFPEATPRNKLELGLRLFMELKKNHLVLATVKETKGTKSPDVKYCEHLCDYGVLRRVGTIRDYHGPGENGVLFQSVGK